MSRYSTRYCTNKSDQDETRARWRTALVSELLGWQRAVRAGAHSWPFLSGYAVGLRWRRAFSWWEARACCKSSHGDGKCSFQYISFVVVLNALMAHG